MHQSLLRNFISTFNGTQHIFAFFSIAKRSAATEKHPSGQLDSSKQRAGLEAVARVLGAVDLTISEELPTPKCHQDVTAASRQYATPAILYGNLRLCFGRVKAFESQHSLQYTWVTRLRPDAVFIAPFVLPVAATVAVIPVGGLGGYCHKCANDHLAAIPRALAPLYFENVSTRLDDCAAGVKFAARLEASHHTSNFGTVGYNVHAGPGMAFKEVGLPFLAAPWPYALTARTCCITSSCSRVGANVDGYCNKLQAAAAVNASTQAPSCSPGVADGSCVEPLHCDRLSWPLADMEKQSKVNHSVFSSEQVARQLAYAKECHNWRCARHDTHVGVERRHTLHN